MVGQEETLKSLFEEADGCRLCEEVVGGIISLRRSNATRTTMVDYLNVLCSVYTSWGERGCAGRINNEVVCTVLYRVAKIRIDEKQVAQSGNYIHGA